MSDLIHSIPNPYEYIINHPTSNRYVHPTHNWYNQQRKQVWRKTQKNTTEAYVDQSNLVPRKVTKKVKSKLIKSTILNEILLPKMILFYSINQGLLFLISFHCNLLDFTPYATKHKKMKLELATSLTKSWYFLHLYNLFLHYKGHPCNNIQFLHSVRMKFKEWEHISLSVH